MTTRPKWEKKDKRATRINAKRNANVLMVDIVVASQTPEVNRNL